MGQPENKFQKCGQTGNQVGRLRSQKDMGGCFGSSIYYWGFPWRNSLALLGLGFPICITVCLFHGVPEGKCDNFTSVWTTGPTHGGSLLSLTPCGSRVSVWAGGCFTGERVRGCHGALCWTQSFISPEGSGCCHTQGHGTDQGQAGQGPSVESLHFRIFSKCNCLAVLVALSCLTL